MYKIAHSNTVVSKLWNLASNGVLDRRTIDKIMESSDEEYIIFNSKKVYDLYKEFEFSTLAMSVEN